MNKDEIKKFGHQVLQEKKNHIVDATKPLRWSDTPLYQPSSNVQAELGYGRPTANDRPSYKVFSTKDREKRQNRESPLKRWYLEQEEKRLTIRRQDAKQEIPTSVGGALRKRNTPT